MVIALGRKGDRFSVSVSGFVPVQDGLHFPHDDFMRDAGARIGESGFDLGPEPCVIFDRVFRRHEVRRRIEVRGGEAV